jgi:hypothetical protein
MNTDTRSASFEAMKARQIAACKTRLAAARDACAGVCEDGDALYEVIYEVVEARAALERVRALTMLPDSGFAAAYASRVLGL